jgi:hypothetical protein
MELGGRFGLLARQLVAKPSAASSRLQRSRWASVVCRSSGGSVNAPAAPNGRAPSAHSADPRRATIRAAAALQAPAGPAALSTLQGLRDER